MPFDNLLSKQIKKEDFTRWFAFSIIALAVLISYFPSLYFPPRADQVIYLSETSNIHKPWDLIIGCYDHNRHRTIGPGDELLFRPLLYALLGSEQVIFGHHFWAWQLAGLMAHLILIWMMLRLLWHLSNPWLAFAGTWLFALSVFNYELVTWPHLSSYMLMMACIVGAIEQIVFCFEEARVSWRRALWLLVYSLIACFIYETANIFVLMMAVVLAFSFPQMKRRVFLIFVPVILYILSSGSNYIFVAHNIPAHAVGNNEGWEVGKYLWEVMRVTCWWVYEGIFNSLYGYIFAIRTMFLPNEVMVFKPLVFDDPQTILGLIIVMSSIGIVWAYRNQLLKRVTVFFLLTGMVFSYVAVIVVGRYKEMGDLLKTLGVNSYYSYLFWVFIVITAFLFINAKEARTKTQKWLVVIFVTASLLSGLFQGKRIYEMTYNYSSRSNSIVLLVMTLDLLIQEKKAEPDFSFYVDTNYPGNYPYGLIRKITDPPQKKYSFAEFLYPQYFRPRQVAKYKFLAK